MALTVIFSILGAFVTYLSDLAGPEKISATGSIILLMAYVGIVLLAIIGDGVYEILKTLGRIEKCRQETDSSQTPPLRV